LTDLSDSEHDAVRADVAGVPIERLQRIFQLCAESLDAIHRSLNPRLLLEMLLIKLAAVEPLVPLQPLVNRLEALQHALQQGAPVDDAILVRYRERLAELNAHTHALNAAAAGAVASAVLTEPRSASQPVAPQAAPPMQAGAPQAAPPRQAGAPQAAAPMQAGAPQVVSPAQSMAPKAQAPLSAPAAGGNAPTAAPSTAVQAGLTASSAPSPQASSAAVQSTARPTRTEAMTDLWARLVRSLPPKLAGVLAQAQIARIDAEAIEFFLPERYLALLDAGEQRKLGDCAAQLLGRAPQVRLLAEAPAGARATLAEERRADRAQAQETLRQQMLSEPLTQKLVEQFGVAPERIKVDVASSDEEDGA